MRNALYKSLAPFTGGTLIGLFGDLLCPQFGSGTTIVQARVEVELLLGGTVFTVATLAQHCGKTRSTVQRAVDKLLDAGIVRLGRGDEDLRLRPIEVTELGRLRAKELLIAATTWWTECIGKISRPNDSGALRLIQHTDTTLEAFLAEVMPALQAAAQRHTGLTVAEIITPTEAAASAPQPKHPG